MLQDDVVASYRTLFGQVVVIKVALILARLQQTCQSLTVDRFLVFEERAADNCLKTGLLSKRTNLVRDSILNLMMSGFGISVHENYLSLILSITVHIIEIHFLVDFTPKRLNLRLFKQVELSPEQDIMALLSFFVSQVKSLENKLTQSNRVQDFLRRRFHVFLLESQLKNVPNKTTDMVVRQTLKLLLSEHVRQKPEDFHVGELNVVLAFL